MTVFTAYSRLHLHWVLLSYKDVDQFTYHLFTQVYGLNKTKWTHNEDKSNAPYADKTRLLYNTYAYGQGPFHTVRAASKFPSRRALRAYGPFTGGRRAMFVSLQKGLSIKLLISLKLMWFRNCNFPNLKFFENSKHLKFFRFMHKVFAIREPFKPLKRE